MSVIAWRIAADERRRSDARVAALSAEIHDTAPPSMPIAARAGEARHAAVGAGTKISSCARGQMPGGLRLRSRCCGASGLQPLFAATPARSGRGCSSCSRAARSCSARRRRMAMLGTSRFTGRRPPRLRRRRRTPRRRRSSSSRSGTSAPAIELTVRGVVRNPASGAAMDRLTAVVLLFTPDGGFLTSGRAVVEPPRARPWRRVDVRGHGAAGAATSGATASASGPTTS